MQINKFDKNEKQRIVHIDHRYKTVKKNSMCTIYIFLAYGM